MADPVAVLVVPAPGDPGGLLARGFNGTVQPIVYDTSNAGQWGLHLLHTHRRWTEALPLWWDGALVPEGWDRARRVTSMYGRVSDPSTIVHVLALAREAVSAGLASRVVLLDRIDGRLVERAP